jgi:hypothetical protein
MAELRQKENMVAVTESWTRDRLLSGEQKSILQYVGGALQDGKRFDMTVTSRAIQ